MVAIRLLIDHFSNFKHFCMDWEICIPLCHKVQISCLKVLMIQISPEMLLLSDCWLAIRDYQYQYLMQVLLVLYYKVYIVPTNALFIPHLEM